MAERPWRSVRAQATIGACVVVGVLATVGAIGFFQVLDASAIGASERAAEVRAEELAGRVESAGPGILDDLEDDVVQVVTSDGTVVAATEDAGEVALPLAEEPRSIALDGEPYVVVSEEIEDDRTLVLGASIEHDAETLGTVALLLWIAVPLVLVLVGLTTWIVVGRALRPVARIRSDVDAITADRLDRRVPVPDSGDEIEALAITMNGMLDRLQSAAEAQRRFVSDASHELRSPLATIRQHAELAQTHPGAVTADELAAVVRDEGLRLQGLVDALLVLARLDEGMPSRREPVDLDDLALSEVARLRAAGVAVDGSGIGAARVAGDGRMLAQLVRNLADNAVRHARSRVGISVRVVGTVAELVVEDDGDGIPAAERERVFDRFVRLDEARARDAGGSGLGLAIVRAIAVAAGGTVRIEDAAGGGARFVVTLPALT